MSGGEAAEIVLADTSVLLNLAFVERLDLLGALEGYRFRIPEEVAAEVRQPEQRNLLDRALSAGHLERVRITSLPVIEHFQTLRQDLKLGRGEAACLALAHARGWMVASDERRAFRREARELLGEGRLLNTPMQVDRPSEQIGAMHTTFSQFSYRATRSGGLVWRGDLTPTFESPSYAVRIVHDPGRAPRVFVDNHDLDPGCRHLYPDDSLCLYWPEEWTWSRGESLTSTLLPWIAFWLYYYELWQETSDWLGPSSPHGLRPERGEPSS